MEIEVNCLKLGEYESRNEYRWALLVDGKQMMHTTQHMCKSRGDMLYSDYIPGDIQSMIDLLQGLQQKQARVNSAVLSLTDALADRPLPLFENPMLEKWWVDEICSRVAKIRDAYKELQK